MTADPFFHFADGRFTPTPACCGPWRDTMLHGRVIAGLLAYQLEREHGHEDFLPARLTVDMYRPPDFSAVTITTSVAREGYRIKVLDAQFVSNGVSMGRASCQLLRRTANPPGKVWSPPNWHAPAPESLSDQPPLGQRKGPPFKLRDIRGTFGTFDRRAVWMSEVRPLVNLEPLTPFQRVALAADFASPCANAGDDGLGYINTDVTVYLHRLPRGEWIGMETVNHHATDGVAIGECWFYDIEGAIGSGSVAALAQKNMLRG
jgi:hypothetical protein